jgi:hypothetical protein
MNLPLSGNHDPVSFQVTTRLRRGVEGDRTSTGETGAVHRHDDGVGSLRVRIDSSQTTAVPG